MSPFAKYAAMLILLGFGLQNQKVSAAQRNHGHSANSVHRSNSRPSSGLRSAKIDNKFEFKHDQGKKCNKNIYALD